MLKRYFDAPLLKKSIKFQNAAPTKKFQNAAPTKAENFNIFSKFSYKWSSQKVFLKFCQLKF